MCKAFQISEFSILNESKMPMKRKIFKNFIEVWLENLNRAYIIHGSKFLDLFLPNFNSKFLIPLMGNGRFHTLDSFLCWSIFCYSICYIEANNCSHTFKFWLEKKIHALHKVSHKKCSLSFFWALNYAFVWVLEPCIVYNI